jgi:hypothetical protein
MNAGWSAGATQIGHDARMSEPLIAKPTVAQRFDLLAASKPQAIKRNIWIFGILGAWSAIGTVSALAVQHWGIAAITCATAAFSGLMWWTSRRAMRRIPETTRWIEGLSK